MRRYQPLNDRLGVKTVDITEIEQRCTQLVADAKKIPAETISPDTTFEELQVDSLDRVSLAFDVEEIYGIAIPESALATIHSVGDMAAGIREALEAKHADAVLQDSRA